MSNCESAVVSATLEDLREMALEFESACTQRASRGLDVAGERDALSLFSCYVEWKKLAAYQELIAAVNDQDEDVRIVAEALLRRDSSARAEENPASASAQQSPSSDPHP